MKTVEEIIKDLEDKSKFDIFCNEYNCKNNAKELARYIIKLMQK